MKTRPPLRLLGADVVPERRLPDGRAIARYLDPRGQPTPFAVAQSLGVTSPAIALPEPPKAKAAPDSKAKAKKPAAKKKAVKK